jgi:hypothetical protein
MPTQGSCEKTNNLIPRLLAPGSPRGFTWLERTTPSGLDRPETKCLFSDERQGREQKTKRMLKMQIAPNMLLKTNGRKRKNSFLANMFMKTNSLLVSAICR